MTNPAGSLPADESSGVAAKSIAEPRRAADRVASVDALRGLTIALMVFVNGMGAAGPAFLRHIEPPGADGMTLADVVFPAFLFIVGVSIPLAFEGAERAGRSVRAQVGHILIRTGTLLLMGVIELNHDAATVGGLAWGLPAFASLILAWCSVPRESGRRRQVFIGLKVLGVVGLVITLATFRREARPADILFYGTVEHWAWLRTKWWGILGLIGWAYLTVATLTLILGSRREWLMGAMAGLMTLHLATHGRGLFDRVAAKPWLAPAGGILHGLERAVNWADSYVSLGDALGSLAAVAMAGCLLGSILRRDSRIVTPRDRLAWAATFALGLGLAGVLTDTFEGINKIGATPTWCFWSAALALLAWMLLYWVLDVLGWRGWSIVLRPAGANPLLAYFLHPIVVWLVDLSGLPILGYAESPDPRVVVAGAAAMALFVCVLTGVLGRLGLRLRL